MTASLAEAKEQPISPEAFLKFDREIRTAKREKDDAGAEFARAKKAAKNGAVDLQAYKFIEQMRRLEDEEQVIVLRHIVQYIQWLEMPIGTQFSMMDAPKVPAPKAKAKAEHDVFQAYEDGLRAGRAGQPASANPFPPGSERFVAWSKKHHDGLAERVTAEEMADNDTGPVADVAKATRGRGRSAKTAGPPGNGGDRSMGASPVH